MRLRMYQVDAFATQPFSGNPAAIIPLQNWLDDALLQAIAEENNLSETAFFVEEGESYHLRWFTPGTEVDLCGHATLASAYVLFEKLGYDRQRINFMTRSGLLTVDKTNEGLSMDIPLLRPKSQSAPSALLAALGCQAVATELAADWLVELADEEAVIAVKPDFSALAKANTARGVIVTARGSDCDFVSRFFAPNLGIDEDPVTGSAHSILVAYWSGLLGKNELSARQLSSRGGELCCQLVGERVLLLGQCVSYLEGEITIPDNYR